MEAHRKYDFKKLHYAGEKGMLIPALQKVQEEDGYISKERILEISKKHGIPIAQIYGVATFYAQFRLRPVGKNIVRVCHGTACHVSGANAITKAVEDELKVANGETTAGQAVHARDRLLPRLLQPRARSSWSTTTPTET